MTCLSPGVHSRDINVPKTNPRIASSLHQARKPRLITVLTCLTMRHLCPIVRHRTPPETLRKLTGKSETRPENRRMTGKCFSGGPGEPSIRARSCARARKITELRVWAASPFSCRRRPPPASRGSKPRILPVTPASTRGSAVPDISGGIFRARAGPPLGPRPRCSKWDISVS